jgi:hypothetical protein
MLDRVLPTSQSYFSTWNLQSTIQYPSELPVHAHEQYVPLSSTRDASEIVPRFLNDSLAIPFLVSVLSAVILVIHFARIATRKFLRKRQAFHIMLGEDTDRANAGPSTRNLSGVRKYLEHVQHHGGNVIFVFKIARVLGCATLIVLATLSSAILQKEIEASLSDRALLELSVCIVAVSIVQLSNASK